MPAAQRRRRRERRLRDVPLRPAAEGFLRGFENLWRIDVADHQQERVVRPVVVAVERLDFRAIDRLQRGLGFARARVRMVAEQRAPELAVGQELPVAIIRGGDKPLLAVAADRPIKRC